MIRIVLIMVMFSVSGFALGGIFPYQMLPDAEYRELNLTDAEVREIEAAVREMLPQAIVRIGAVKNECKCEEGPECLSQVVVDGRLDGINHAIALSQSARGWAVSREWAMRHQIAELVRQYRQMPNEELWSRIQPLIQDLRELSKECSAL